MYRRKPKLLAALLVILLVLPAFYRPVLGAEIQANQNPPLEEIARKIEIIARTKQIPSVILKAIAYAETGWRQFDKNGNVVTNASGSRPSLGIMQITSYNPNDTALVNKLKYDIDFNIAYGADLLNAKWEAVPKIGDGDRNKLENWYFALWAYNSWSTANNPNNAAARGRVAYQDKIIKIAATEYYKGLVTPVQITPIPRELLPAGTLPKKSQTWNTPEPFTLGDLRVGVGGDPSRGDGQEVTSSGKIGTVTRIAGENRIDTVNKIALAGWPHGAETVIITRADAFPDALAGVPLAKQYNAPILITDPNELDQSVIDVLNKLKPLKAIILGGETAVSPEVENKLAEVLYWTDDIVRIAGQDRFETAVLIVKDFPKETSVALATGMDFPDALSLATAAAGAGIPLLLTAPDELPDLTRSAIQELLPRDVYIVGGEKAVSEAIVEEVAQITGVPSTNIVRFYGNNRYETSVKIAEAFCPDATELYLASGENFSDPLAAGALAAMNNSCLLLTAPQGFAIGSPQEDYLRSFPSSTNVTIIGGKNSIPDNTVDQVKYLLNQI
ncbi:MAG TPA: transglycosylase SLT domain-containing protein [Peptococcaceae bacterium]|nr:transglycosylase SLT domain-containing protein [Peptococcaceae bacterium]